MSKFHDVSILVLSCDAYGDLWDGFFECFFKNANRVDLPIYLGSNSKKYSYSKVTNIMSEDDPDWSSTAIKLLSKIETKYVIVLLEDIYFSSEINYDLYNEILGFINYQDVNYIRLFNRPEEKSSPNDFDNNNSFIKLPKFHPYRINVVGLWNREFLLSILIPGENPWNFEIMGSYRSSYYENIYTLKSNLFEYKNMVEKGIWIASSVSWAKKK